MRRIRPISLLVLVPTCVGALLVGSPSGAEPWSYSDPVARAVKVSAGPAHTCVVDDAGALTCWGYNQDGQLNVPTDLGPVEDVAVGTFHTCALRITADISCWGWNGLMQTDVPRAVSDARAVAAGYATSCALRSTGVARCWGAALNRSDAGYKPWRGNGSTISQVSLGGVHGCALMDDASVICWGGNSNGESDVPVDLPSAVAVSAGDANSCAVLTDGEVRCWGSNVYGQSRVPSNLGSAVAVSAGGRHTCALLDDATVRCWGADNYGQSTVPMGLADVDSVSAGGFHTCAVTATGAVSCWGNVVFKDGSAAAAVPPQFLPWPADFPDDDNPAPAGALQILGPQVAALNTSVQFFGAYGRAGQPMSIGASGMGGRAGAGDAFGYSRFTTSFTSAGKKTVTLKAKIGSTAKSAAMTVWVPKVPASAKVRAGKPWVLSVSALPPGVDVAAAADSGESATATSAAIGTARISLTLLDKGIHTVTVSVGDTEVATVNVTAL